MQQVVQQQQEQMTAGDYWNALMADHPVLAGIFSTIVVIVKFFIEGHFVIVLGRWAVMTGGRIAETAMLLSVLWITAARVAPELVIYVPLNAQITASCIIALSLLPEIILFHAIVVCHDHWRQSWQDGKVQKFHLVFAVLYTVPTAMFIGMTVWTLVLTATTGTVIIADGMLLSARYLAGWFYSLVEMIYPLIARRYHMQIFAPSALFDISSGDENVEQLSEQIAQLEKRLERLKTPKKLEPAAVAKTKKVRVKKEKTPWKFPRLFGKKHQVNEPQKSPADVAKRSTNEIDERVKKVMEFLQKEPQGTDEMLANFLGMDRPAAARFWRLKAMEFLPKTTPNSEKNTDPNLQSMQPKTTQKLSPDMLHFPAKNQQKTSGNLTAVSLPKKNFFTKKEAAKLARVSIKDIDEAVQKNLLATAKNDPEKILKSSLEKFVAARKNQSKVSA